MRISDAKLMQVFQTQVLTPRRFWLYPRRNVFTVIDIGGKPAMK